MGQAKHSIVIVGGGAAGIATAASLLSRSSGLDIAIIEPSQTHYYQPGWTLVGAGVFNAPSTARSMASVMPKGVVWIQAAVTTFEPSSNQVSLDNGGSIGYDTLIVCPGIKLDWAAVDGLEATLGRNGVTSNYRYDLSQYTWKLVQQLKGGRAIFTQPPMPIKCAGAPQKAMYLSADAWKRAGCLDKTTIQMYNAGAVLFGRLCARFDAVRERIRYSIKFCS
jgi:sulfide:quinone oxidoreductase